MTDTDVMRELAAIDLDLEGPDDPDETKTMTDEEFDTELALAADGRWDELGLDDVPDGWQAATIDDLRAAQDA